MDLESGWTLNSASEHELCSDPEVCAAAAHTSGVSPRHIPRGCRQVKFFTPMHRAGDTSGVLPRQSSVHICTVRCIGVCCRGGGYLGGAAAAGLGAGKGAQEHVGHDRQQLPLVQNHLRRIPPAHARTHAHTHTHAHTPRARAHTHTHGPFEAGLAASRQDSRQALGSQGACTPTSLPSLWTGL